MQWEPAQDHGAAGLGQVQPTRLRRLTQSPWTESSYRVKVEDKFLSLMYAHRTRISECEILGLPRKIRVQADQKF